MAEYEKKCGIFFGKIIVNLFAEVRETMIYGTVLLLIVTLPWTQK